MEAALSQQRSGMVEMNSKLDEALKLLKDVPLLAQQASGLAAAAPALQVTPDRAGIAPEPANIHAAVPHSDVPEPIAPAVRVVPQLSSINSLKALFTWWFTGMNDLGPLRDLPLDICIGKGIKQRYSEMLKFFAPIQQRIDAGATLPALIEQEETEMSTLAAQTAAEPGRKRKRAITVSIYVSKKIGKR
ncbi:hypothetical protein WJX73_002068 [Symbiochloris irregularis]|uniref:Uncharacterized protein n=1 Tax=Symbiochloris irregularis TaxID=706552 RepID=A0AAW1NVU9_9CHLO